MKLGLGLAAALAVLGTQAPARADGPVIVGYTAPADCASAQAFHALLASEIARTPNAARPWRFSVRIRHDGDYVGTLATEGASRELRAPTCDDVTAALALVIATAEPALPAPQAQPRPPPAAPIARASADAPIVEPDRVTHARKSPFGWRFGLRAEQWSDGSQLQPAGVMATASLEVPWGLSKTMFELGAGALFRGVRENTTNNGPGVPPAPWIVVDAQACPVDVPLGATGFSLLGCGIVVVGTTGSLAGWGGAGGRVRWQSPWSLFVETHFNGLYGTRFEGIPALMDFGGSLGFRI